ncbi:hypothetical protein D3C81_2220110 [compost metagenome]
MEELRQHKVIVEKNLEAYKNNAHLLSKYQWTAEYHNYFIEQFVKSKSQLKESGTNLLINNYTTGNFDRVV